MSKQLLGKIEVKIRKANLHCELPNAFEQDAFKSWFSYQNTWKLTILKKNQMLFGIFIQTFFDSSYLKKISAGND